MDGRGQIFGTLRVLACKSRRAGADAKLVEPMALRDRRRDDGTRIGRRVGEGLEVDVRGQVLLAGIRQDGGIFVPANGLQSVAGSRSP